MRRIMLYGIAWRRGPCALRSRPYPFFPPPPLPSLRAVCKLAKKGLTPSQIGVILRDNHGVAQVKSVAGTKILRLLKKNGACVGLSFEGVTVSAICPAPLCMKLICRPLLLPPLSPPSP